MEEENQKLLGAPGTTEKKVIWDTPVQARGTGPTLACVLCLAERPFPCCTARIRLRGLFVSLCVCFLCVFVSART
jgi:hypothetical protein